LEESTLNAEVKCVGGMVKQVYDFTAELTLLLKPFTQIVKGHPGSGMPFYYNRKLSAANEHCVVGVEDVAAFAWHWHLGEGGEVAGHKVLSLAGGCNVAPDGDLLFADVLCEPAARVEPAATRRVQGGRHIALQDNALAPDLGVGDRDG
jgi:hypothetical protein